MEKWIINLEMTSFASKGTLRILMKEVVNEKGMFHHGPISRADVRTHIGMQRLDLMSFKKLGFILDDMEGWNF